MRKSINAMLSMLAFGRNFLWMKKGAVVANFLLLLLIAAGTVIFSCSDDPSRPTETTVESFWEWQYSQATRQGAVKVPFDPNVGWAIININDSKELKATAHLESGLPNEAFDVTIRVRYEDGTVVAYQDIATLYTNKEGKGNIEVIVNLDPPSSSGTIRRVAVRLRRPGPPNIVYIAVAWDVPLKEKIQVSQ